MPGLDDAVIAEEAPQKEYEGLRSIAPENFYLVKSYGDPNLQMLEVHCPVLFNGETDPSRPVKYVSSVMVNWRGVPFEKKFEIKAATLEEAVLNYREFAAAAGNETLKNLAEQEARALEQQRIEHLLMDHTQH